MRLYGRDLANQLPDDVSGHKARLIFGACTEALAGAYQTLAAYDSTGFGQWTGLDAGSVAEARRYLDETNALLQKYFPHMPASDAPLNEQQHAELRAAVSTSSAAAKVIDDNFSTSFLAELVDSIIAAVGTVTAQVAAGVAKVAGSTLGALWWVVLPVGLVLAVLAWRKYLG